MPKIVDVTKIFCFLLFVSYAQCNVELDQRLFKKTILERLAKQDAKIKLQDEKMAKQDDLMKMLEAEIKTCKAVQKHINETIDRHDTQIEKINGSLFFTTAMEEKEIDEGKWMLLSTHYTVHTFQARLWLSKLQYMVGIICAPWSE